MAAMKPLKSTIYERTTSVSSSTDASVSSISVSDMAAMDKFKALVERSGSSDSQDTWISIKKDVNDLQKEIQLDLRKCKAKLIETLYELKAMTAELKKREDEIKTLNDGIRILEDTITELNAKARKYDRNADELESQANIKSKQAWAGVASGLFGILLAPATGGISLVATVAGGGFAVNGFVEAKEKRNKAEEARSDARDKIELVQEKKKKLAQDQEEITIMSADKQRYQDVIDARQKVIADLENLRNNISTYLFLIEYKINSSQKPLTSPIYKRTTSVSSSADASVSSISEESVHKTVDEKLVEIVNTLNKVKPKATTGIHTKHYIETMVPRITEHVNAFQETIQNKYRSLLQNKSEQLNDQEKSEFIDFLEQNRQQIAKEQGKLGDDMLQHINKIMEEQTVLNALRVDVDKIKEEILDNKNRIMGLQRQERELEYEIKELNQIATEKDMASNAMRAVGVGSLAVSAVGVVLTPMTGGASLLLSGTGGALAAYSLSTAEEYRLAAKQKRKEADQVRQEMIRIQSKIDRLNTEINTKESQIEKKNQTIASILDDQNILRRILEQLSKFMDIINNLKAVL